MIQVAILSDLFWLEAISRVGMCSLWVTLLDDPGLINGVILIQNDPGLFNGCVRPSLFWTASPSVPSLVQKE